MSDFFGRVTLLMLGRIPRNLISRYVGRLVSLKLPNPLRLWILRAFAQYYSICLPEAEKSLSDYESIQALFTRRLSRTARRVEGPVIHPVDGKLTESGVIESGALIQAKGISYLVDELLAESSHFDDGIYVTYYLCPTDYHRVHAPCDLLIQKVKFIPGDLWPVNQWSVQTIPKLFAINERVVVTANDGHVAVVLVGATNVGQISLSVSSMVSNRGGLSLEDFQPPKSLKVGDELGVFNMGSTVIVLYSKEFLKAQGLTAPVVGRNVKMGQLFARLFED